MATAKLTWGFEGLGERVGTGNGYREKESEGLKKGPEKKKSKKGGGKRIRRSTGKDMTRKGGGESCVKKKKAKSDKKGGPMGVGEKGGRYPGNPGKRVGKK